MESTNRREGSTRLKKNVSKLAYRGKERMMRSLGMGEETKDEIIENYAHLVNRQQAQFLKFQRDLKVYVQSINAMRAAANTFYLSLTEIYDDAWVGKDMIPSLAKTTELLYSNLCSRMNVQVMAAIQEHLNQCNDVKTKVQKRGRKVVDFDGAKRSYLTLKSSKKVDDGKLSKAEEQVNISRGTYETLNSQLHQELPDLYDSRVLLSTDVIGTIATAEKEFFTELADIRSKLLHVLDTVKDAYAGGDYRIQRLHSAASQPTFAQQSTLPSDNALVSRSSRGNSEALGSDRSFDEDTYDQPQQDNHSEAREQEETLTPSSVKRPNDYVNIQIGDDDVSANDLQATDSNSNIYDHPEFDEQQSDSEYVDIAVNKSEEDGSCDVKKPIRVAEDLPQKPASDGETDSIASDTETNKVPFYHSHTSKPADATSEAKSSASTHEVVRRAHSRTSEEETMETQKKRSSLLGTVGLGRLMSTLTRSSKAPTKQEDPTSSSKPKKGLFSMKRLKKDKVSVKDMSEKENASTLPPPQSTARFPPREVNRSVKSSTDESVDGKPVETSQISSSSQSVNMQQIPHDETAGLHARSREEDEKCEPRDGVNELGLDEDAARNASFEDLKSDDDKVEDQNVPIQQEAINQLEHSSPPHAAPRHFATVSGEVWDQEPVSDVASQDSMDVANVEEVIPHHEVVQQEDDLEEVGVDLVEEDASSPVTPHYTQVNKGTKPDGQFVVNTTPSSVEEQLGSRKNPIDPGSLTNDLDEDDEEQYQTPRVGREEVSSSNDESDISSYHSSQIDSQRSSVSVSDEVTSVSESPALPKDQFTPNQIVPQVTDGLRSTSGQNTQAYGADVIYEYASDVKDQMENKNSLKEQVQRSEYENVQLHSTPHQRQESGNDGVETENVYTSLDEPQPAQPGVVEDDFEDSVYDTIIVTNRNTVADSQPIYDTPDQDGTAVAQNRTHATPDPSKASKDILPPHFLYKAEAMYPYQSSDDDELNFSKGDIIYVVEFPDPEEQDEGWQMGILKLSWEDTQSTTGMAVFPENFTRRL